MPGVTSVQLSSEMWVWKIIPRCWPCIWSRWNNEAGHYNPPWLPPFFFFFLLLASEAAEEEGGYVLSIGSQRLSHRESERKKLTFLNDHTLYLGLAHISSFNPSNSLWETECCPSPLPLMSTYWPYVLSTWRKGPRTCEEAEDLAMGRLSWIIQVGPV